MCHYGGNKYIFILNVDKSLLTLVLVNPAENRSLCVRQTHVMDISHVV